MRELCPARSLGREIDALLAGPTALFARRLLAVAPDFAISAVFACCVPRSSSGHGHLETCSGRLAGLVGKLTTTRTIKWKVKIETGNRWKSQKYPGPHGESVRCPSSPACGRQQWIRNQAGLLIAQRRGRVNGGWQLKSLYLFEIFVAVQVNFKMADSRSQNVSEKKKFSQVCRRGVGAAI